MKRRVSFKLSKYSFKESLKYSLIAAGIYAALFLLAKIFGMERAVDIHYLNYAIAFAVAYQVVKKVFESNQNDIEYYNTFMIGMTTVIFAQLWFAIFFYSYLLFDYPMVAYLHSITPHNIIVPRLSIAVILFSEGFGLSPIISLALTEFFKWRQSVWGLRPRDTH